MNRTKTLLLSSALLMAASLSACGTFNGPDRISDERQIYPITVSPQMETLRVPFNGAASMTPEMDGRLTAFTKDYLDSGNGAIAISVPGGDEQARRYFATRLSEMGVPAWRIMIGSSAVASPDGAVELSYIRYGADSPACGDWSTNAADTANNMPPPNFGCATQHNLAAMVADPRDLVSPHREDPADAQRRMQVLDKYRKGLPTPSEKTPAQSAAISDVNKQ